MSIENELLEQLEETVRGKVINNWLTAGMDVCLVCGELPASGLHDEDCWVAKSLALIDKARKEFNARPKTG